MTKPFAALGLCLALLAAPVLAQQPSTERTALLARLRAALPPTGGPPFGQEDADEVRQTLLPLNPGRETAVEALASAKFACLNGLFNSEKVLDLLVEAADQRMTAPDIQTVINYYEGPDYKALIASASLPDGDPRKEAAGRKPMDDPVLMRFFTTTQEGVQEYWAKPSLREAFRSCERSYQSALAKSGLKHP